ncbi:MAG: hypothetical protein WC023_06515 [Rhodocyclaceae bacterium]
MAIENVNAAARDPHAYFRSAFMAGQVVQYRDDDGNWWDKSGNYYPAAPDRYRIRPEPDPYASLKAAQEAGKVIQCRENGDSGPWLEIPAPRWVQPPDRYRIKPEEPAKAPEPAKWTLTTNGSAADVTWTVDGRPMLTTGGTDATVTVSLRRPSDGPEMAIPEPQFPYNIATEPPSSALPACAGLTVVWADPCWARR